MIKQRKLPAGTPEKLRGLPQRVSAFQGLDALWLFGSYARGEETPLSDLDFAYLAAPAVEDCGAWDAGLYRELSSYLATDEMTLVDLAEAPPLLAFRVLQEGMLLVCRDSRRVADLAEQVLGVYPEVKRLVEEELRGEGGRVMEIDREKVASQLRLLEADLRRLREKVALPEEEYLADPDAQDVMMRRFQTAIESCVNVGNHLIAALRLRLAEDYATVFQILSEAGVLSRELTARMAELARFRNLLVHVYWRVDQGELFRRAGERVRTLEAFGVQVREFLAAR